MEREGSVYIYYYTHKMNNTNYQRCTTNGPPYVSKYQDGVSTHTHKAYVDTFVVAQKSFEDSRKIITPLDVQMAVLKNLRFATSTPYPAISQPSPLI